MRSGLVPLCLLLSACAQRISTASTDADLDAAVTGDGEALDAALLDATPFQDAGASDAMTTLDALPEGADAMPMGADASAIGTDAGGMKGPLTWGRMTLPPNANVVQSLWGRSASEIYAGTGDGDVLQYDGHTWRVAWHSPNNFGIQAIWGTATGIFVADETALYVHGARIQSSPSAFSVGTHVYDMTGKSDAEVYLVSDLQNGRGFFAFDGMSVTPIVEPTDIATLASLGVSSSGDVFVGGNGAIFRYAHGVYTMEAVDWPMTWSMNDILGFTFFGVGAAGTETFAVGSRHLVFRRDASGTWRQDYSPFLTDDLHRVAGWTGEAYAVGGNTSRGPIERWYQGQWQGNQLADDVALYSLWSASSDLYYAGGSETGTFNGVLYVGSR
jgi:hypothetical protein